IIYPFDLFEIKDKQQLQEIIEPEIPGNRTISLINNKNMKEIKLKEAQLKELNIQLDGLMKEKRISTDTYKIQLIDKVIKLLEDKISDIDSKIKSLITPK